MNEIVRYKNRKLYDKTQKKFITIRQLDDLYVKTKKDFKIIDNTNEKDITYNILVSLLSSKLRNARVKLPNLVLDLIESVVEEVNYKMEQKTEELV
jgi:polyhydroxyalkanoate synthesis regulator protein